jgi:hypothetical protein
VEAEVSYLKTRTDANQKAIVRWLRVHGCEVRDMARVGGGYSDTLVWRQGTVAWVEIKVPGSRACFYRSQLEFMSSTKMNVIIATSPEQALADLRNKTFLTQMQKDGLAGMLAFTDKTKRKFTPTEVNQAIGKK